MRHSRGMLAGALGLLVLLPATGHAVPADWSLAPWQGFVGDAQLDVGGAASGAVFSGSADTLPGVAGGGGQNASGIVKLSPRLHRDYDTGLSLGLDATFAAGDRLSRGRYGGDAVEKIYGDIQTGLGRAEIGQTDGAAYDLAVTGPKVDDQVSLDNPQTTFFRDPRNGHAVTDIFTLRTEIGASSNDAKLVYASPTLFGAQLALSFTPSQGKDVLPFLREGPQVAGRQADIWEGALKYAAEAGPVSLSAYGGLAVGRGEHKQPGQEGVSDLGAGLRADYPVNDDVTLALGGAFRQSNAYAFDIDRAYRGGTTRAVQASASVTDAAFVFGIEYGGGEADGVAANPHLGLTGYQASLGYVLNPNIQATIGWQRLTYDRAEGVFYNGLPHIGLDAGFLHLNLHT